MVGEEDENAFVIHRQLLSCRVLGKRVPLLNLVLHPLAAKLGHGKNLEGVRLYSVGRRPNLVQIHLAVEGGVNPIRAVLKVLINLIWVARILRESGGREEDQCGAREPCRFHMFIIFYGEDAGFAPGKIRERSI